MCLFAKTQDQRKAFLNSQFHLICFLLSSDLGYIIPLWYIPVYFTLYFKMPFAYILHVSILKQPTETNMEINHRQLQKFLQIWLTSLTG